MRHRFWRLCLWVMQRLYPYKDRALAWELRDAAWWWDPKGRP